MIHPVKKWRREDVYPIAKELCDALKPVCERLIVAGSFRRKRPLMKDLEILFVPKLAEERDGLFETKKVSLVDKLLEEWLRSGVLRKRENVNGGVAWGDKNKLAVHAASGLPVDFFATKESCFWNYLACRTGPKESNIRVATAARRKGWIWHPYERGFTTSSGRWIDAYSEKAVFALVGLPYLEPWQR